MAHDERFHKPPPSWPLVLLAKLRSLSFGLLSPPFLSCLSNFSFFSLLSPFLKLCLQRVSARTNEASFSVPLWRFSSSVLVRQPGLQLHIPYCILRSKSLRHSRAPCRLRCSLFMRLGVAKSTVETTTSAHGIAKRRSHSPLPPLRLLGAYGSWKCSSPNQWVCSLCVKTRRAPRIRSDRVLAWRPLPRRHATRAFSFGNDVQHPCWFPWS